MATERSQITSSEPALLGDLFRPKVCTIDVHYTYFVYFSRILCTVSIIYRTIEAFVESQPKPSDDNVSHII